MTSKKKILIVDEDLFIHKILEYRLSRLGYYILHAFNGQEALVIFKQDEPDLIILDIIIAQIDGFGVCQKIRDISSIPIIILTGLNSLEDKIAGFEIGADDYITKPFSIKELEVRIRALMRRSYNIYMKNSFLTNEIINIGQVTLDCQKRQVSKKNNKIKLTNIECSILKLLMNQANEVVSRHIILHEVWGNKYEKLVETRVIDVHISKIRSKIENDINNPEFILTARGIGYIFRVTK
uniref:Probable transcriptional regulator ycf27 n=1 Tax=Bulboplastis apyrenoidosa TaxID=1070855 RepID=A0A1X9PTL8_9RHOD|nr:transcription regulatory protein ompR [Bulboplastis apyrenoidosa]ARO90689.1 transcription regulatory protein ompR [Bulboplastis apyrenoidosa]